MPISRYVSRSMEEGGWIRRMFEIGIALKAQYGEDSVFDLSLGNPIMEPPPEFHEELRRIAQNPLPGMHRYMPNAGYAETRQAVADYVVGRNGTAVWNRRHCDDLRGCRSRQRGAAYDSEPRGRSDYSFALFWRIRLLHPRITTGRRSSCPPMPSLVWTWRR